MELPQLTDKPGTQSLKGHEFVSISYHMPTTCEVCSKQLWHMFRPPPALECRRKYETIFRLMNFYVTFYNPFFFLTLFKFHFILYNINYNNDIENRDCKNSNNFFSRGENGRKIV